MPRLNCNIYILSSESGLNIQSFLSDPGVPGPIYGFESLSLRHLCANLTDVTLADEDSNSILTDNANGAM